MAGHVLPLVLLHPRHGIAIAGGPVEAVALVRQRLERARFPAIFPGVLPILRLSGPDSPVERAFAGGPTVNLPGGDAWVAMARQALETEASPALPARVGIRARRRQQRHRLLLAGGLAFLLLGGSGLGLLLLTQKTGPGGDPAPVLATRTEPAPAAPIAVPAPPAAASAGPPAALPGRPVDRPGLSPAIPAPPAPPVIAPPVPPTGLAAVRPAPAPLPPLPAPEPPRATAAAEPRQPEPYRAEPPQAKPRQAEALPPPAPHRQDPDPTPTRRPAPAVQEARNLPAPISAQSIAGAQRCRLITQRIQIGDPVADADIRFLQRGCPD